jgi:hypothetical protein
MRKSPVRAILLRVPSTKLLRSKIVLSSEALKDGALEDQRETIRFTHVSEPTHFRRTICNALPAISGDTARNPALGVPYSPDVPIRVLADARPHQSSSFPRNNSSGVSNGKPGHVLTM